MRECIIFELVIGTGKRKNFSKEKCGTQKSHLVLEIWNRPPQQTTANTTANDCTCVQEAFGVVGGSYGVGSGPRGRLHDWYF